MTNETPINPLQKLRDQHSNLNQFKFGDRVKVNGGFFDGQSGIINDVRDTIPENNPNQGDPEIVISYQVRILTEQGETFRIVDTKYLDFDTPKKVYHAAIRNRALTQEEIDADIALGVDEEKTEDEVEVYQSWGRIFLALMAVFVAGLIIFYFIIK